MFTIYCVQNSREPKKSQFLEYLQYFYQTDKNVEKNFIEFIYFIMMVSYNLIFDKNLDRDLRIKHLWQTMKLYYKNNPLIHELKKYPIDTEDKIPILAIPPLWSNEECIQKCKTVHTLMQQLFNKEEQKEYINKEEQKEYNLRKILGFLGICCNLGRQHDLLYIIDENHYLNFIKRYLIQEFLLKNILSPNSIFLLQQYFYGESMEKNGKICCESVLDLLKEKTRDDLLDNLPIYKDSVQKICKNIIENYKIIDFYELLFMILPEVSELKKIDNLEEQKNLICKSIRSFLKDFKNSNQLQTTQDLKCLKNTKEELKNNNGFPFYWVFDHYQKAYFFNMIKEICELLELPNYKISENFNDFNDFFKSLLDEIKTPEEFEVQQKKRQESIRQQIKYSNEEQKINQ